MIRSILVGLDTPGHGEVVSELAIRWARRFGAGLVGLAIVDEPGIRAIEPLGPVGGKPGVNPVYYVGYDNRMAQQDEKAHALLEDFSRRCEAAGVEHEAIVGVGAPDEVIEREARATDLVLMASRTHFYFTAQEDEPDDGLLRRVLPDTPRPVVVVPAGVPPEGPIVIAYDGSLQAERALSTFEATGLAGIGPVHVVSVDDHADEAARLAGRARHFLTLHRIEATAHAIPSTDPPGSVILAEACRLGAGLIVMGAYGKPVLREFFLGSATQSLLENSSIAMFLYH